MKPYLIAIIVVSVVAVAAVITVVLLRRRRPAPAIVGNQVTPAGPAVPKSYEWVLSDTLSSPTTIVAMTASRDGSTLAALAVDGQLTVYRTGAPTLRYNGVGLFCLSPSGTLSFLSTGGQLFIRGSTTGVTPPRTPVIALCSDEEYLYASNGGSVPRVTRFGDSGSDELNLDAKLIDCRDSVLATYDGTTVSAPPGPELAVPRISKLVKTDLGTLTTNGVSTVLLDGRPVPPPAELRSMGAFGTDVAAVSDTFAVLALGSGPWSTHVCVYRGHNYLFNESIKYLAGFDSGFYACDGKKILVFK
jgi:hypothetical protein